MLTVSCVYSRVVDISKPFFVIVIIISSKQHCVNMYIKDSPCWSLPLELNNLALFTPTGFRFHVGLN